MIRPDVYTEAGIESSALVEPGLLFWEKVFIDHRARKGCHSGLYLSHAIPVPGGPRRHPGDPHGVLPPALCRPEGREPHRGLGSAPSEPDGFLWRGDPLRRTGCGSGAAVPGEEKTAEGQPAPWDFPCPIIPPDRSPLLRRHGGEGPVWDDGKVDGDGIGGVSGRMQRRRPTDH